MVQRYAGRRFAIEKAKPRASGHAGLPLVPGRECGSCNVCCVALTIRDPDLQKAQGVRCHNADADNRCSIYDTRPMTCREFHCGWRHLKWVQDAMRPDRSSVLVRLRRVKEAPKVMSVVFTILAEAGLEAEGMAESMAAAIASGVPTYMEVPGAPGWTAGIGQVNAVLADAVRARDKAQMLTLLRLCWEQGRVGDRVPVKVG